MITYAGYITGFQADSYDSLMHDIDLIKRELPIDILEFFYLTPLPGSEDHQRLHRAGVEIAVVHILRFEGGKIVEMWDIGQEIPADSPNALGMF